MTKKLVPRVTTEGGIGTAAKVWGDSYFMNLYLGTASSATKAIAAVATTSGVGAALILKAGDTTGGTNVVGGPLALYAGVGTGTGTSIATGIMNFTASQTSSGTGAQSLVTNSRFYTDGAFNCLQIYNPGDINDFMGINVGSDGSTTIYTKDNASTNATLNVTIDGDIVLDATHPTSNITIDGTSNTTEPSLYINCDSLTSASGISLDVDDSLTTNSNKSLILIDYDKAGNTASGQGSVTLGLDIAMNDNATGNVGQIDMIGSRVNITSANDAGSIYHTGYAAAVRSGDPPNTIAYSSICEDGGMDFKAMSSADATDYFSIATGANGATTLTTVDAGSDGADLTVDADGDIVLDPHTGRTVFKSNGTVLAEINSLRQESFVVALSDETTVLTTGTGKATFMMPYAFTIQAVIASVTTVSSSGVITIDINEGTLTDNTNTTFAAGATILSATAAEKLTIDQGENTSTSAATAVVISDASIAAYSQLTFDIDGHGTGAKGLKVVIIGHKTV